MMRKLVALVACISCAAFAQSSVDPKALHVEAFGARGDGIADCLRLGAACGALSTLGLGGTARQPDASEAEALIRSQLP